MIRSSTVDLPVVQGTDTIGEAIDRLRETGKSGVVAMDNRRFVVLEDWSLRNSLVGSSGNRDVPVGKVAEVAFMKPERGILGFGSSRPITGLAQEQRNYTVTGIKGDLATVATDPKRAAKLTQPSVLFVTEG